MANSRSGDSMTERIVRVLETFSDSRSSQTAAEIGRRAMLPASTAHRIVDDLVAVGLLERDEDLSVRLGMRLWELAQRGSTGLRLRQIALPHMQRVQQTVHAHTQLAVREGSTALFLERLSAPGAVSNIATVAGRLPLHASSSGLVLLAHSPIEVQDDVLAAQLRALTADTITDPVVLRAHLDRIRAQGFVVSPGSVESVSTGVAVVIRRGAVTAALGVVLDRDEDTERPLAVLRRAARDIEADLRSND